MSAGLLAGREAATLDTSAIKSADHKLVAAQLLDGATATCAEFVHCTFANVSFKDVALLRCKFINCAFVDCYFRHTEFRNCQLTGCKFSNCIFDRPRFVDTTLLFPGFRSCYVPFNILRGALPRDPGLRRQMADELAREAGAEGASRDARLYRLVGEEANEKHLWNLAWASGGDYYEKQRPPLARVDAGLTWLARKFNRLLWGYGERGIILARSFFVVAFVVFPLLFWSLVGNDLTYEQQSLSVANYLLFSLGNLLAGTGFSGVVPTSLPARWIVASEVLVGLLFIGLFISLIFNWIRRR